MKGLYFANTFIGLNFEIGKLCIARPNRVLANQTATHAVCCAFFYLLNVDNFKWSAQSNSLLLESPRNARSVLVTGARRVRGDYLWGEKTTNARKKSVYFQTYGQMAAKGIKWNSE